MTQTYLIVDNRGSIDAEKSASGWSLLSDGGCGCGGKK